MGDTVLFLHNNLKLKYNHFPNRKKNILTSEIQMHGNNKT